MTILDYRGQPIKTSVLTKELAVPSVSSVRTIWYDTVASGLTPEALASIIVEVDQNDIVNYLTLAEEMEERDLHYHSVLSTRKLAVSGLDVVVEAHTDETKDIEIADFVDEVVNDDAFGPLVDDALDAIGKGFSVCEIMWDRSGAKWTPTEYKWRDPRHFTFDQETGRELRLLDEQDPAMGIPLPPFKFVTHVPRIKTGLPIRGGLARLAVVAYMCKGFTIKDWMAFAEIYGMPLRVGKYSPAATEEQKTALLTAVSSIGTDAAAIIPEGMIIEFVEGARSAGGEDVFNKLADWLDKQVSKGVLGQTATVEGTPGKLGADEAQTAVRQDIRESDSVQLAATLRRDLVKPLVDLNFGPLERGTYPKLRIFTEEGEDLELLSKALPPFIDRGLAVQASVIRDKFGLPEPEDDAVILQPGKQPTVGGEPDAGGGPEEPEETPEPPNLETVDPNEVPADDGEEVTLQREQRATVVELMRRVRRGEELTADQRVVLVAYAARFQEAGPPAGDDFIDDLADVELARWRKIMDPVFQPLLDHANASDGYQQFLAGLDGVLKKMDSTAFMESIATSAFKARGQGDATDDTD